MPRKAAMLYKRDLDQLRRKAQADPGFSATRADGAAPGLYVEARRGKVTFFFRYRSPVTGQRRRPSIGEYGFIALLQDSEGNRIGIHSRDQGT